MKLSRAGIALYMGLVFASGAALGVFGNRYYTASTAVQPNAKGKGGGKRPSPEEFRQRYLAGMQKQLLLSDEQVKKLGNIMDETRVLMDTLHKRQQPEQAEIQRSQNEKIRAVFDNIQREKYDEMLKRMAEKGKLKNKGRQGGGF
jgi:Spy/CpxP family protein refolding chaperone